MAQTEGQVHTGPSPRQSTQGSSTVRFSIATKPSPRTRTTFKFAHPPPRAKSKQRLKIRPRLLLQLHLLSEQSRAFPTLDVLASTIFASRLASKWPKLFKGKDGLGPNDLIIMSSGSYEEQPVADDKSSHSEDENWVDREVIATICQLRKQGAGDVGKAEICTNSGQSWEGTPLLNGSYDFTSTNADGTMTRVRWVLRSRQRQRASSMTESESHQPEDKKFTFSIIKTDTRRHPVIASMNKTGIEIMDQYPSELRTSSPATSSPPSPSGQKQSYFDTMDNQLPGQALVNTDEHLRSLIVLTGLWVLFREGWSRNFSYEDAMSQSSPRSMPPSASRSRMPSRTNTLPAGGSGSPLASPTLQRSESSRRRFSGQFLKRGNPSNEAATNGTAGALYLEKANRRTASVNKKGDERKLVEEKNLVEQARSYKRLSLPSRKSAPPAQDLATQREKGREQRPATSASESPGLSLPRESVKRTSSHKEKTVSTATTLIGTGDSDHAGHGNSNLKDEDLEIVKDVSPVKMKPPKSPLPKKKEDGSAGKQTDRQPKRWGPFGKLANAISCR